MKIEIFFILCLTALLASTSGERVRYDNYQVYKVKASNRQELELLKQMEDTSDSLLFLDGVYKIDRAVNIVVPPHKVSDFLLVLDNYNIAYNLVEKNLQTALEKDYQQVATYYTPNLWSSYQKLSYNYRWLQTLPKDYPGEVTLIEAGKTYEKRSILGVKISLKNGKKNKPAIFIEAGIHAREWIAPATATYIINALLTSSDKQIRELAENYEWYIIPHANPDGYVYTHSKDRMWRKTRQPYGTCFGADPNRNFNISWNSVGSESNPCSNLFAGGAPNSEIEVASLSNYIDSLKHKIKLYISLHSYSQYLLYPFGYKKELPENAADYKQVFDVTIKAISKRYGTVYTGGNIYDAIYPAAGSSVDYAYSKAGIRMAFCFELRPSESFNGNGMELPADQIVPTAEEILDALVAMVNKVKVLGYFD